MSKPAPSGDVDRNGDVVDVKASLLETLAKCPATEADRPKHKSEPPRVTPGQLDVFGGEVP